MMRFNDRASYCICNFMERDIKIALIILGLFPQ